MRIMVVRLFPLIFLVVASLLLSSFSEAFTPPSLPPPPPPSLRTTASRSSSRSTSSFLVPTLTKTTTKQTSDRTHHSSLLLWSTLAPTQQRVESTSDDDDDDDQDNRVRVHVNNNKNIPAAAIDTTTTKTTAASSTPPPPKKQVGGCGGISMTIPELSQVLGGTGRARLAWDCYSIGVDPASYYSPVIRLGHDDFESILEQLPSSRRNQRLGQESLERLAQTYSSTNNNNGDCVEGGVASLSHVSSSFDSTTKLLLRLADGLEVETVIIPWNGVRSTLCISSQVGCRQGCTFCATGRMGKLRSLTSDEILAQMFFAKKLCRLNNLPSITNVVFMGMGEPSDNAGAVKRACEILTTRELFQLSATKLTVSTVGPSPDAFRQFASSPCVLAWSVHAVDDQLRRKLVPTTKHSMKELQQGFIDALLQRPHNFRTTMLEAVLIDGINDSPQRAEELAGFAREIVDAVPGCKLVVNLIPYNDIGGSSASSSDGIKADAYKKPHSSAVDAFKKRLWSHGVNAHVRTTRGDDESAACGQLATSRRRPAIAGDHN